MVKLELYYGDKFIFDMYDMENEIQCFFECKVEFKLGGYLIIDQIEVMIMIDINMGVFVGCCNFEEIIFNINIEVI